MNTLAQSPDNEHDHAALLADLDARAAAQRTANQSHYRQLGTRAAQIDTLPEPQRTLGYAAFAAELYAPRTAGGR
jgi:hypothetical protein